jgi:uncharacterized 2Fe-2S/4Fe-4S cluster protein (DUF4445 family)
MLNKMVNSTIVFQPYGKRTRLALGTNILDAARRSGISMNSICGGEGFCGKCTIIIQKGKERLSQYSDFENRLLSKDELNKNFRLACQTKVIKKGLIVIEVPLESQLDKHKFLLKGLDRKIKLAPAVKKIKINIDKPSLEDSRSDSDRVIDTLKNAFELNPKFDYEALKKLPYVLRESEWTNTIYLWRNQEIICIEPNTDSSIYGFAVDAGTTKLAGYLLDLSSGKTLSTTSIPNPQIAYGEDVISRIHFIIEDKKNLSILQKAITEGINQMISEICKNMGISPEMIRDITLAGNTAMHHIFLGISPEFLAKMPFSATLQSSIDVKAREIGLSVCRGAYVHALPVIAGFVGGDAVADILATEILYADDLSMIVDIGTNTEIVLGDSKKLVACSCASGPALEGAHIKNGMRAVEGAIEHLSINPNTLDVKYKTISEKKPLGLCGSAIIDAIAELLKVGLIDRSGKFNKEFKSPRLRFNGKSVEFVISWKNENAIKNDIVVTQKDVREVQLAKAAIYTGIHILMTRMHLQTNDIKKIFLAGAFGNYIDPYNAKIIGMYPDISLDRVSFVGNTAGSGARMTLVSVDARKEAAIIAKNVDYVELGAEPNFQNEFIKAILLPHQEYTRFPNVNKTISKTKKR